MSTLTRSNYWSSAARAVAMIGVMLLLIAGSSEAQSRGGRGRAGGPSAHAGYGGAGMYGAGGHDGRGGGGYAMRGGGGYYGPSRYYGHYGRPRYYGPRGYYYRPGGYYGYAPYYGMRPYYGLGWYGYGYPHSYVSFGFGVPYAHPPVQSYPVAPPAGVSVPLPDSGQAGAQVDVENEPPAGYYYYDPFCQRQFSTLDDYTDHLGDKSHPQTIDIVERNSGTRLRTLEFVDGLWRVKP